MITRSPSNTSIHNFTLFVYKFYPSVSTHICKAECLSVVEHLVYQMDIQFLFSEQITRQLWLILPSVISKPANKITLHIVLMEDLQVLGCVNDSTELLFCHRTFNMKTLVLNFPEGTVSKRVYFRNFVSM